MHEQIKVLVASGASTSSLAQFSRTYPLYGIQVGTMSTGTVFGVMASTDNGSTFYNVFNGPNVQTSTVTNLIMQVGSLVGTNGGFVVVNGGYKDFQIKCTGVVSGGISFNIFGYDV